MQFEPSTTLPSLSGYTMLLPCVSVGNVGQLAVDVLLATLQPTLISQVLKLQFVIRSESSISLVILD